MFVCFYRNKLDCICVRTLVTYFGRTRNIYSTSPQTHSSTPHDMHNVIYWYYMIRLSFVCLWGDFVRTSPVEGSEGSHIPFVFVCGVLIHVRLAGDRIANRSGYFRETSTANKGAQ